MQLRLFNRFSAAMPDYKTVWRWHFYAGLVCLPFVLVLAVSGALYLFKAELEVAQEQAYNRLQLAGPAAAASLQIESVLSALPEARFKAYELPRRVTHAARVMVVHGGETQRVFVHPQTLQVLGQIKESDRLMPIISNLHGELLLGDTGSIIVEIAASWTVVLILTGLFLWWPRQSRGLAGVFYPRLTAGQRVFWRDIHSVTGVYISGFTLFLLVSGLPWSNVWGDYLRQVRKWTGTASSSQDWVNRTGASQAGKAGSHGHGKHRETGDSPPQTAEAREVNPSERQRVDLTAIDRVVAVIQGEALEAPVVITPPTGPGSIWTVKSMTANRPWRVTLKVDATTGRVSNREGFWDRHWVDRLVAVGIAAHEGRLFGWPNQLLGLGTAMGLVLVCVSGAMLWWKRRDAGTLGAPAMGSTRVTPLLIGLILLLGLLLPLFGLTLLVVLILEYAVLRRIGPLRHWLGLRQG